jgi:hypothetical protein
LSAMYGFKVSWTIFIKRVLIELSPGGKCLAMWLNVSLMKGFFPFFGYPVYMVRT